MPFSTLEVRLARQSRRVRTPANHTLRQMLHSACAIVGYTASLSVKPHIRLTERATRCIQKKAVCFVITCK